MKCEMRARCFSSWMPLGQVCKAVLAFRRLTPETLNLKWKFKLWHLLAPFERAHGVWLFASRPIYVLPCVQQSTALPSRSDEFFQIQIKRGTLTTGPHAGLHSDAFVQAHYPAGLLVVRVIIIQIWQEKEIDVNRVTIIEIIFLYFIQR